MTAPLVSIIAAMDEGGVIGKGNALPWRLPADLRWFKEHTLGKPVVMGRETCESIGEPLAGRKNIVLSRKWEAAPPGFFLARTPEEALRLAGPVAEVMIAGGAQVFALFLPRADRLYLTEVGHRFEGDTFFPLFDRTQWIERHREYRPADGKNPHATTFLILDRAMAPGGRIAGTVDRR
jgi:dihydrofolate reductase